MIAKTKTYDIITLEQAKDHLRLDIDFTEKDNNITELIKAAIGYAENYIDKDIAATVNTLVIDDFTGNTIEIGAGHASGITSLQDTDSNNLAYKVKYNDSDFIITLNEVISAEQQITLVFASGFNANNLPPPIKQAILIKIADLYDHEGSSYQLGQAGVYKNNAFENLLNFYVAQRIKHFEYS